jgi:hypothetical protein
LSTTYINRTLAEAKAKAKVKAEADADVDADALPDHTHYLTGPSLLIASV